MTLRRIFDRLRNRTAAFAHDVAMIPLAWLAAYWLRFNLDSVPPVYLGQAFAVMPVLVLVQGGVFWYLGLYRGVWRFASLPDLVRILKAIVVGVSLSAILIFFFTRMQNIPRSVFPLHAVLLLMLLGGPRMLYRWLKDRRLYYQPQRNVLIVGAGRAGELLVRELLRDRSHGYHPVAFIDDDIEKKGREIHGVRVVGMCEKIPRIVERMHVDLILLALPTATAAQMRRIVGICEQTDVPIRTLPALQDLVSGRASVRALREISIEDLLGRDPISLDWAAINLGIAGKVILVTGGGGSIGGELCRQIARLGPKALIVVDNGEHNLFTIGRELAGRPRPMELHTVLGDVCDAPRMVELLGRFRPEIVFHAAAYKHVPMLEHQAREAVRNNVLGTDNVARAAAASGVASFVLISTDKAVNPANVMGATKRVAEILCQRFGRRFPATRFITVRFGNVLDSAGSVVPLFRAQIATGGPVTVTHPAVERYFMTIPEACQLIMQAAAIGRSGEVYVLDMGEPVKIGYLAEQMIRLAGKTPGEDVEILYVGLRPGEKLTESLFHEAEHPIATSHDKIRLARGRELDWGGFDRGLEALRAACDGFDEERILALLRELVPEFEDRGRAAADNVVPIERVRV